jgi:hypothetical protein
MIDVDDQLRDSLSRLNGMRPFIGQAFVEIPAIADLRQ